MSSKRKKAELKWNLSAVRLSVPRYKPNWIFPLGIWMLRLDSLDLQCSFRSQRVGRAPAASWLLIFSYTLVESIYALITHLRGIDHRFEAMSWNPHYTYTQVFQDERSSWRYGPEDGTNIPESFRGLQQPWSKLWMWWWGFGLWWSGFWPRLALAVCTWLRLGFWWFKLRPWFKLGFLLWSTLVVCFRLGFWPQFRLGMCLWFRLGIWQRVWLWLGLGFWTILILGLGFWEWFMLALCPRFGLWFWTRLEFWLCCTLRLGTWLRLGSWWVGLGWPGLGSAFWLAHSRWRTDLLSAITGCLWALWHATYRVCITGWGWLSWFRYSHSAALIPTKGSCHWDATSADGGSAVSATGRWFLWVFMCCFRFPFVAHR